MDSPSLVETQPLQMMNVAIGDRTQQVASGSASLLFLWRSVSRRRSSPSDESIGVDPHSIRIILPVSDLHLSAVHGRTGCDLGNLAQEGSSPFDC